MKDTEIVECLRSRLFVPGGRHLYGVLGPYSALESFARKLQQAKDAEGRRFPKPVSVNRGILDAIPDEEFRNLAMDEAKRPEPTAAHVARAFEMFLRERLRESGLVVLNGLEMIFAYQVELSFLRTVAADDHRVLMLLAGRRSHGRIMMFPELDDTSYVLPTNLIADNHLWELNP